MQQFAIFCSVGLISALVDLGSLQSLLWLGLTTYLSVTAGFFMGLGVNLVLHARLTFGIALNAANSARYCLVVLINYLLTLGCVTLSERLLSHYLPGKLVALPLVALLGFTLSKHWIFKTESGCQAP
jgi:putative flippase GtrA